MFPAESLFIATVLGGVDVCVNVRLCVQYMCTCGGVWTQDTFVDVCLFFLQTCGVCVPTVCPSVIPPEIGHIYPLLPGVSGRRDGAPFLVQCLLKQHHSLIFNNLLNSVSWRSFCHHVCLLYSFMQCDVKDPENMFVLLFFMTKNSLGYYEVGNFYNVLQLITVIQNQLIWRHMLFTGQ